MQGGERDGAGLRGLLSFWFTSQEPVTRGAYVRHGAFLGVLKYTVDAAVVGLTTGRLWTPLEYVHPLVRQLLADPGAASDLVAGGSADLVVSVLASPFTGMLLAVWTLPFLWIGVYLSMRRLIDAGWSAWWSLLFFAPVLRVALFLVLAFAPSDEARWRRGDGGSAGMSRAASGALAVAVGSFLGIALLWLGTIRIETYGYALFMGTPFVCGVAVGYIQHRLHPVSVRATLGLAGLTVLTVAVVCLALGIDGAVCLITAAPLAYALAALGAIGGRQIAAYGERAGYGALLIVMAVPGAALSDGSDDAPVRLREVRTSVVIDAPPATVWAKVIAFEPLDPPRDLPFLLGVAYPVRAEIDGSGVGAIRYCVFSTGAFVEPITAWEPGVRLAFDVIESPPPLRELSFRKMSPPHLDGYLLPHAGEFRLIDMGGGRTRLEGRTWYEQRLAPHAYWALFSDVLIGRIHRMVLQHIEQLAEADS